MLKTSNHANTSKRINFYKIYTKISIQFTEPFQIKPVIQFYLIQTAKT